MDSPLLAEPPVGLANVQEELANKQSEIERLQRELHAHKKQQDVRINFNIHSSIAGISVLMKNTIKLPFV